MKKEWKLIEDCDGEFYQVKVVVGELLSEFEARQLSGCIGYALREVLAGEGLSDPLYARYDVLKNKTRIRYDYDSTKSQRDDPDFAAALEKIKEYAEFGTPVRKTNREGPETKGTRLVEGIGITAQSIKVFVR